MLQSLKKLKLGLNYWHNITQVFTSKFIYNHLHLLLFLSFICNHLQKYFYKFFTKSIFLILQQKMIIITRKQKAKETKEEKITSVENLTGYDDIVCKFILCIFNLLDRVVNLF